MSIQFLVPLMVSAFYFVNAADLCADPSKMQTIKYMDITKGDFHFVYCQSAIKGKNINFCKVDLHEMGDNTTAITSYYYDSASDKPKEEVRKFSLKMLSNPGEYEALEVDPLQVTSYMLDSSPDGKCATFVKCFSGGKWAGSEDSGGFVGRLCLDASQCADKLYEPMIKNITENFLAEGVQLEDTDRKKCEELGMM